jgi:hypothetical protein
MATNISSIVPSIFLGLFPAVCFIIAKHRPTKAARWAQSAVERQLDASKEGIYINYERSKGVRASEGGERGAWRELIKREWTTSLLRGVFEC